MRSLLGSRHFLAIITLLAAAPAARGKQIISFNNSDVSLGKVSLLAPAGLAELLVLNEGTAVKLGDDGFEIRDISYKITALRDIALPVGAAFSADRLFSVAENTKASVTLFGETAVVPTAGQQQLLVNGTAQLGMSPFGGALYRPDAIIGDNAYSWNVTGRNFDLTAGAGRSLNILSSISWGPAPGGVIQAGDSITLNSVYRITIKAVPEPSAFALTALGATGFYFALRRPRRDSPPS